MPNNRIPLNNSTAKLLNSGSTAFILPWPKQPPKDTHSFSRIALGGLDRFRRYKKDKEYGAGTTEEDWFPPAQSGKPLYLLETWATAAWSRKVKYLYKADYKKGEFIYEYPEWRSPVTMPNSACRLVWKDWKVEAVQVKDIIGHQWEKCGASMNIWNINGLPEKDIEEIKTNPKYSLLDDGWFIEHGNIDMNVVINEFTTTYPHLGMNAWVWYFEKG